LDAICSLSVVLERKPAALQDLLLFLFNAVSHVLLAPMVDRG
jgi:hypothetical protein